MFFKWIDINGTKKCIESDTFTDAKAMLELQQDFCIEEAVFNGMDTVQPEDFEIIKVDEHDE